MLCVLATWPPNNEKMAWRRNNNSRGRSHSWEISSSGTCDTIHEEHLLHTKQHSIYNAMLQEKQRALDQAHTQIDLLQKRIDQLTQQLLQSQPCAIDRGGSLSPRTDWRNIQMRVDGAGYIGQVQTARVWIDSWFITWSRVPVDADGQPKMEYVQPIPHATCPSYVPSVDDIGYQLIAECHVRDIHGPIVATCHSVTIEYDPDMLKVMIPLLKSGRAELEAWYRGTPGEEQQQRVCFVIQRHKTRWICAENETSWELSYERCRRGAEEIAIELDPDDDCALRVRVPHPVMRTKNRTTTTAASTMLQDVAIYEFSTRTKADRDLLKATMAESIKLFFGQASPAIAKEMEASGNVLQQGARRVRQATRKIFHLSSTTRENQP